MTAMGDNVELMILHKNTTIVIMAGFEHIPSLEYEADTVYHHRYSKLDPYLKAVTKTRLLTRHVNKPKCSSGVSDSFFVLFKLN